MKDLGKYTLAFVLYMICLVYSWAFSNLTGQVFVVDTVSAVALALACLCYCGLGVDE